MSDSDYIMRWLRETPGRKLMSDSDGTIKAFSTAGGLAAVALTLDALADKLRAQCSHKFVDSNVCLKCGWKP